MSRTTTYLPEIIDRRNWGEIFTDEALWRPVVRRICRRHEVAEGQVIRSGYPGSCAVFIVDRSVVVKIYPPFFAADFEREILVYEAMQDRLPYIPRILAQGVYRDRITWPYIVLSFCEGRPIREVDHVLSPEEKREIGRELGRLIGLLHEIPVPVGMARSCSEWQNFLLANRERTLNTLRKERPFPDGVTAEIEGFLAETEPLWLEERPLRLINADLTQDHLLLTQDDGRWRISGIIDWADAEAGLPAYEWIPLWHGLCGQNEDFFQAVLSTYDPELTFDKGMARFLLAYTFLHRFGGEIVQYLLKLHGSPKVAKLSDLETVLLPNQAGIYKILAI